MRLSKFGHSCILVETGSKARLLIDPGVFSRVPEEEAVKGFDAVLITHLHPDHLDLKQVRELREAHPDLPIHGPTDAVAKLAEEGIVATDHAFADFEVAGARIEVLEAGHEPVLGIAPMNAAYRVDGELVVTGDSDSQAMEVWAGTRVLALVTFAPWTTGVAQVAFMERMRPEIAFAVHDGFVIDAFKDMFAGQFGKAAEEQGARFVSVGGEPQAF